MRVTYRLSTNTLAAVAAEAAWAENMGYDSMSSNETAHDSFLPLALAATSTTRAILRNFWQLRPESRELTVGCFLMEHLAVKAGLYLSSIKLS